MIAGRIFTVLVSSFLSIANAQEPSRQTLDQLIATQIGNLIIQVTSQSVQIEQLRSALAAAQAHAKELEDKQKQEQETHQ